MQQLDKKIDDSVWSYIVHSEHSLWNVSPMSASRWTQNLHRPTFKAASLIQGQDKVAIDKVSLRFTCYQILYANIPSADNTCWRFEIGNCSDLKAIIPTF